MTQIYKNKNSLLPKTLNLVLFLSKFEQLVILSFLIFLTLSRKILLTPHYKKISKDLNMKDNLLYNQKVIRGVFSFEEKFLQSSAEKFPNSLQTASMFLFPYNSNSRISEAIGSALSVFLLYHE